MELKEQNMRDLRDLLRKPDLKPETGVEFDMGTYCNDREGYDLVTKLGCGLAGCAVGHITLLPGWEKKVDEMWENLAFRFTGLNAFQDSDFDIWEWCFSPCWVPVDNSPEGAAKRIDMLLEGFDVYDLLRDFNCVSVWDYLAQVSDGYAQLPYDLDEL